MFANTQDSPEQKRILRHLKELFYTTPEWKLRQLCIANDWNCRYHVLSVYPIQICIDVIFSSGSVCKPMYGRK